MCNLGIRLNPFTGQFDLVNTSAGGTVTNVTATSPLQSTGGATPNISFEDQSANTVLAGPTSGPDAPPDFRALVAADIAGAAWTLAGNTLTGGTPATPNEFLGSTNNYDWVLRTNNVEALRVKSTTNGITFGTQTAGGVLLAAGIGALSHGRSDGAGSSLSASATGAKARGQVTTGAVATASGIGATLNINSTDAGTTVTASGILSIINAAVTLGSTATASGNRSHINGIVDGTGGASTATASGNNSSIWANLAGASTVTTLGNSTSFRGQLSAGASSSVSGNAAWVLARIDGAGSAINATGTLSVAGGHAITAGTIVSSGDSATAWGVAQTSGNITASGIASIARGSASGSGTIVASGDGSESRGRAQTLGSILASNAGSKANGMALDSGTVSAGGEGSHASGRAENALSAIRANGHGSRASGYAIAGGTILANGLGSHVFGYAPLVGLNATGKGGFAIGVADVGNIESLADGAFAGGTGLLSSVTSNGVASFAYGTSLIINGANYAQTFGVGHQNNSYGAMIVGTYAENIAATGTSFVSTDPAFIVGTGILGSPVNGFRVDKDGRRETIAAHINKGIRTVSGVTSISARTDRTILVDTTGGAATENLPAGVNGLEYYFDDSTGNASTNNITINANGADVFQGGASSYVINSNNGTIHIQFNAGIWNVISSSSSAVTGFANTALSNLITTSINQDLLPDTDINRNLGSNTLGWLQANIQNFNDSAGNLSIDTYNRRLKDSSGTSTILDWFGPTIIAFADIEPDTTFGRSLGTVANPFDTVRLATLALFDSDASDSVQISAASTTTGYSLTMPPAQGTSGQTLQNDGAGNLSWVTSGSGTVTSVTAGTGLNVGAGPGGTITTTGTLNLANTAVTPGSYTLASITVDAQGRLTSASNGTAVTSVALSLPSIFTVTGSPVTTTGTLTGTLNTQTANTVFAGPASGGAATPTFRAILQADLPTLATTTKTTNYTVTTADRIIFVDSSGGAFNLTLPDPSTATGIEFRIIDSTGNLNANNVTLVRFATEKISGVAASRALQADWGYYKLVSNGTDWFLG